MMEKGEIGEEKMKYSFRDYTNKKSLFWIFTCLIVISFIYSRDMGVGINFLNEETGKEGLLFVRNEDKSKNNSNNNNGKKFNGFLKDICEKEEGGFQFSPGKGFN